MSNRRKMTSAMRKRLSDCRSGDATDNAVCRTQERDPARDAESTPGPLAAGGERTALINRLRAVLLERGVTVAQGRRKLERYLSQVLDSEDGPRLLLEGTICLWDDDIVLLPQIAHDIIRRGDSSGG